MQTCVWYEDSMINHTGITDNFCEREMADICIRIWKILSSDDDDDDDDANICTNLLCLKGEFKIQLGTSYGEGGQSRWIREHLVEAERPWSSSSPLVLMWDTSILYSTVLTCDVNHTTSTLEGLLFVAEFCFRYNQRLQYKRK